VKDTFGKRLRQLRQDSGLTQGELGKVFNVTNVGVAKWEADTRFPDRSMLIKIADHFEVSVDYLLCRTDHKDAAIYNDNALEIEYSQQTYPDGLTHEKVLEILETLKKAGFKFEK